MSASVCTRSVPRCCIAAVVPYSDKTVIVTVDLKVAVEMSDAISVRLTDIMTFQNQRWQITLD